MKAKSADESDGDQTGPGSTPSDASDDRVAGKSDTGADQPTGDGVLGPWVNRVGWAVAIMILAVVVLFALGIIGVPSAGLTDTGEWGSVSEERTEVITTAWVSNPNPVGISVGDSLTVDYDILMNDVLLAEGEQSDISVPTGNNTVTVRTGLHNDRLADWWVGYVRADETIHLAVDGTLTVRPGPLGGREMAVQPPNRTVLADAQPVVGALSASANATSGRYTQSVDASDLDESILDESMPKDFTHGETVMVGYEVQRGGPRGVPSRKTKPSSACTFAFTTG
jgi:LEA14-like dessication related protein